MMETSPKFPQRIACLWFPNWPIQRLVVARPELRRQYLVLFQQDPRRGRLVAATSPLAMQAGVRVGMPLSEAKSLLQRAVANNRPAAASNGSGRTQAHGFVTPIANNSSGRAQALRFVSNNTYQAARAVPLQNPDPFFIFEHDPAADHLALTELADSLSHFSPIVGLEQIDSPAEKKFSSSILLEITGLERLFGSEERLAAELFQFVQNLEYVPRLAIANTLAVAWGASRFATSRSISGSISRQALAPNVETNSSETNANTYPTSDPNTYQLDPDHCLIISPNDHETFLNLPIESLRLAPSIIDLLHQLGIETNEQLWRLPRTELAMRFGDAIHRRIDQATGKLNEPVVARQTPTEFTATQLLEYPTDHRETIEVIIGRLVEQIGQQLQARQQGGLQWLITLLLIDEPAIRLNLNLFQATATASEIMPLVEMQLEQQLLPKHPKKSWPSHSSSILKRDDANDTAKVVGDEPEGLRATATITGSRCNEPEGLRPTATIARIDENKRSSRCRIQVQEIRVAVTSAVLLVPQQRLLFDEGPQLNRQALTQLINRLTSRLGQQQVVYPQLLSGAQPEYSYRFRPLVDIHRRRRSSGKFAAQSHVVGRPLRIFNPAIEIELDMKNPRDRSLSILCDTMNPSPPAPLPPGGEGGLKPGFSFAQEGSPEWHGGPESQSEPTPLLSPPWGRGVGGEGEKLIHALCRSKDGSTFTITQATGPERIETGWWRGPAVCRDYWRVETDTGQSLWIYRDLRKKSWFLQGEF